LEQLELSLELSHKTQAQTNAIKCTRNLHVSQVSQRPSWTRLDKKPRHFALWNEASSAILPVSTLVTPAVNPMQTLILAINISSIQYIYIYCIYTYCIYTYYTYVYILYIILYIFTIYIYIYLYTLVPWNAMVHTKIQRFRLTNMCGRRMPQEPF
jgi:hypothetical protein